MDRVGEDLHGDARAQIASTHSWIAAEASGQAIAAPTSWRVARSTTIVTWPVFASTA